MTYTNEDFEWFYIRYQAEAMPRGMSIQAFCSHNGVPSICSTNGTRIPDIV